MVNWKALVFLILFPMSLIAQQNVTINSYRFGTSWPGCTNVLINGDIESGAISPWWKYSDGSADLTATTSNPYAGTYCLQFHINTTGTSNVQVSQGDFALTNGVTYKASFYAKASANRSIFLAIMQNDTPYGNLGLDVYPVAITTSWQLFEYTFQANASESNVRWYFGIDERGITGDDFYFDNLLICAQ
jgi:hypothetical protein